MELAREEQATAQRLIGAGAVGVMDVTAEPAAGPRVGDAGIEPDGTEWVFEPDGWAPAGPVPETHIDPGLDGNTGPLQSLYSAGHDPEPLPEPEPG